MRRVKTEPDRVRVTPISPSSSSASATSAAQMFSQNMSATSATPMISGNMSFSGKGRGISKVGEAVGGTAAVICCLPFAVINLVVLAVYKVPIGLWKRARNRRRRRRRSLLSNKNKNSADGPSWAGLGLILSSDDELGEEDGSVEFENGKLEEEMYGEFYRGFWRSPSQKGD